MTDERGSVKKCDAELGLSNDSTFLERLSAQSMWAAIIANNVRAFILHAVLVIISGLLIWGPPFAALLALVCYPYFTYRYFKPVERKNALSVAGPGIVLLAITTLAYFFYLPNALHTNFPLWMNLSGWMTVWTMGMLLFNHEILVHSQVGLVDFPVTLVPSLLMYIGLCIKINKEKREKKHGKRKRKQKLPPRIQ